MLLNNAVLLCIKEEKMENIGSEIRKTMDTVINILEKSEGFFSLYLMIVIHRIDKITKTIRIVSSYFVWSVSPRTEITNISATIIVNATFFMVCYLNK